MKTLVAVPCMDMMHTQFVHSLLSLHFEEEYEVRFGASSLIYDTRNQLLAYALENSFERVLWFDSDMTFTRSDLECLIEDLDNGYEIVSGLYFKRKPPFTPTIFKTCEIQKLEGNLLDPVSEVYTDYPNNSIFEIAACGFGCVMMDMNAVKRIVEKMGRMLFMPVAGFGEDLSFCLRARSLGMKIWCDSRIKCGHVGEMLYNEEFYLKSKDAEYGSD